MAGYTASLTLDGIKDPYDVLSFSMGFSRLVDMKGRPSSRVEATGMSLTIEIAGKPSLAQKMINAEADLIKTGTLKFTDSESKSAAKRTIVFTKGFITSYSESFNPYDGSSYICQISIEAEKIDVGDAKYDAQWPISS